MMGPPYLVVAGKKLRQEDQRYLCLSTRLWEGFLIRGSKMEMGWVHHTQMVCIISYGLHMTSVTVLDQKVLQFS